MPSQRQPRFARPQIIRLSRFLYMKYNLQELAQEIGITDDTICRCYIPAGCPHERDQSGLIWIVGTAFRTWAEQYLEARRNKPKRKLGENEAWCFRCNTVVKITDPTPRKVNALFTVLQGQCEICGCTVNRGWKNPQEHATPDLTLPEECND